MKRSYEHKQNEVFSADNIIQIQSENPVYNATLQIVLFFLCGSNEPDQILYTFWDCYGTTYGQP